MATTRLLSAMVATWNNVATTFTGLKLNVTDTASASGSLLLDLQVGGVSQANLRKDGALYLANSLSASGDVLSGGFIRATLNTSQITIGATSDIVLARDAANTLALRKGTAAQKFSVYNTYTDASNYERGVFDWAGTANTLRIGTEAAGTGTVRNIQLVAGANSVTMTPGASNLLTLNGGLMTGGLITGSAAGITTAGNIIGGGFINAAGGALTYSGRSAITSPVDANVLLRNNAGTDFSLLQFGGTSSSFPALKRSATGIQVRLADDSAFAPLASSTVTTSDTAFLHNTSAALANGAAAQVATMTNGPTAGNPTKWIAINDNGVTRYIPAW